MNTFFSLSLIGAAAAFSSQQALTHLNFQEWQDHHAIRFETHQEYRLRAGLGEG